MTGCLLLSALGAVIPALLSGQFGRGFWAVSRPLSPLPLVYHISPQKQQQTYVALCTKNTGWLSVARSISSKGEFAVTPRAALVNEGSFSARHLFRTCAASGFNSSTV